MDVAATHSRDQLRKVYCDAWRKHLERLPLTPLEAMLADVVGAHPEYQALVRDPDAAVAHETGDPGSVDNPFLHMGLHMALREQRSIDRPPGVRDLFDRLEALHGDFHRAEHAMMEALAETLWDAQRAGREPDEALYLARVRQRLAVI